jgi:high-affinity iron transporter
MCPRQAITVWDTSSVLSDTSLLGRVLHTLIGYTDQPSGMQLLVYGLTLITIFGLTKAFKSPLPTKRPAVIG